MWKMRPDTGGRCIGDRTGAMRTSENENTPSRTFMNKGKKKRKG
jgi:hypothetical protein